MIQQFRRHDISATMTWMNLSLTMIQLVLFNWKKKTWVFLQKNKMALGFPKPYIAEYNILIYFHLIFFYFAYEGFTDIKRIELVSQNFYWPNGICILLYNLYYINMKILYISLCASFVKLSLGLYIDIYSFSYTIYFVFNTFKNLFLSLKCISNFSHLRFIFMPQQQMQRNVENWKGKKTMYKQIIIIHF